MIYTIHNFTIKEFCAKDSVRPELTGVFVKPNETCATDSFTLIKVSSLNKDSNFKSYIIDAEQAGLLAKSKDIYIFQEKIKDLPKIDAKFPEYNAIFQEQGRYVDIQVSPKFLKRVADFYQKFSPAGVKMRVPCGDEQRPIKFYAESTEHTPVYDKQVAEALIMPIMSQK